MPKFNPEQISLLARIATGRSASYSQALPFEAEGLIKDGKDGWIDLTTAGTKYLEANGFEYNARTGWVKTRPNPPKQKFLVPAFFVMHAASSAEADDLTSEIQAFALAKGIQLYLDEGLPTVAVSAESEREFHTVMDEPDIQSAARKALEAEAAAAA